MRIHSEGGKIAARFEKLTLDDLDPGEVVIRVTHSDINYKDALAATGAGKILRRYPQVEIIEHPFVDFAGQCNFGLTQIATPWVLSLDADYELSEALVEELRALVPADRTEQRVAVRSHRGTSSEVSSAA